MLELLWLVPTVPFASFLILAVVGPRMRHKAIAAFGAGSIAISAAISALIGMSFLGSPPPGNADLQTLWNWINVAGLQPKIGLYLDGLSLVMMLVVTFVGFLIHLYAVEFMSGDEGYSRFFAYMNLFVASMVTLVLASDLLLLYLGWEGVGVCSYLLIGFWYEDPANGRAAQKAFIVTRAGDVALAIGLYVIFNNLGTLEIQEAMRRAAAHWPAGSSYAIAAAALILGGAVGKSAQLPLQTWLPDAMAGPTPTSALIHAATMVTAGVYLIARTHIFFMLAPPVQTAVAVIGAATLLMAGFSALTQSDIKRVLAYSTVSQIGYMFLALGVGAWSAAIFHFMTHAFFKALLFLTAGAVIHALHHEHNIFRMGGLRRELPVTFWTFLIGGSALAGLPLITAGFYSKDLILWETLASKDGSIWLWAAGIAGVLLTSLYIYRLIFIVFFGEARTEVSKKPGLVMRLPLVVLGFLSLSGGFVNLPQTDLLKSSLPSVVGVHAGAISETVSQLIAASAFAAGLYLAYLFFLRKRRYVEAFAGSRSAMALHEFWFAGWGFDRLYDTLFVRPIVWVAKIGKDDFIDSVYDGIAAVTRSSHRALSLTETGRVRWYAAAIAAGSVFFIACVLIL